MDDIQGLPGTIVRITFKGEMWYHYGILDGIGGIIHLRKRMGKILLDPLSKVLAKAHKVEYFNDDIEKRMEILAYAKDMLGKPFEYSIFNLNCESWVNYAKTGLFESSQVNNISFIVGASMLLYNIFSDN